MGIEILISERLLHQIKIKEDLLKKAKGLWNFTSKGLLLLINFILHCRLCRFELFLF
jgi:hypothetical protein